MKIGPGIAAVAFLFAACGGEAPPADPSGAQPKSETESILQVTATDFALDLHGIRSVPAGRVTVETVNEGEQPHQAQLYLIAPGNTFEDFVETARRYGSGSELPREALDLLSTPEAFAPGIVGVAETESHLADLEPATYAVVCNIVDPETAKPHYRLGMVTSLKVT